MDAHPPATVGWYRTGRTNRLVSGGSSDAHRLVLDPVQFGDFGTYRCVALNRVGVASASVEIESTVFYITTFATKHAISSKNLFLLSFI